MLTSNMTSRESLLSYKKWFGRFPTEILILITMNVYISPSGCSESNPRSDLKLWPGISPNRIMFSWSDFLWLLLVQIDVIVFSGLLVRKSLKMWVNVLITIAPRKREICSARASSIKSGGVGAGGEYFNRLRNTYILKIFEFFQKLQRIYHNINFIFISKLAWNLADKRLWVNSLQNVNTNINSFCFVNSCLYQEWWYFHVLQVTFYQVCHI